MPDIGTRFDVVLPLHSQVRKKVRYLNGYDEAKTFHFISSKPDKIRVITEQMLIEPNAEVRNFAVLIYFFLIGCTLL